MNKYHLYKKPNFFQRNFSFAGKISAKEFWSDMGISLIGFLCASIVLCMILVAVVPGDTQKLIRVVDVAVPVLALIWSVSIAAMTRRRLRDAGLSAKNYFWLLLPVIGWIAFVVMLCFRTAAEKK